MIKEKIINKFLLFNFAIDGTKDEFREFKNFCMNHYEKEIRLFSEKEELSPLIKECCKNYSDEFL